MSRRRGVVWLVGAGPGDPDLLTIKAARLIAKADVALYDSLIAPQLLDTIPETVERIHVGKRASRHTLPQEEINDLMVRLAGEGKRVLRLKGGDPFVFGRGGEEIERLAEAGVDFEIVPGVTAALGCAAYAGIPLTHRDYAQSVRFVTGHPKEDGLDLDWSSLTLPGQTVVFYMARTELDSICRRLREHGLPDEWPAALVTSGATVQQHVIASDLANLPRTVAERVPEGPALLIVGEVVRLRERLAWYGKQDRPIPQPPS